MLVRLAFSVAIQVDADILLIDEVLAVGDAALPAEVLRRVRPPQGERPHDRVRDPRHERGRALLRPRDAARAGQNAGHRRAGARSPAATTRSTSAQRCTQLPTERAGPESAARRADHRRRGSSTPEGAADRLDRPRRARASRAWRSGSRSRSRSRSSAITLRNDVGATVFATTTALDADGPTGSFQRRRDRRRADALRELADRVALQPHAVDRAARNGRGRDRHARGHRSRSSSTAALHRRRRRPALTASRWSAGEHRERRRARTATDPPRSATTSAAS